MYSQNNEEVIIAQYFNGFVGHFLDIGAYDGVNLSNTRLFVEKGWLGVMVEPSPSVIPTLVRNCEPYTQTVQIDNSALWYTDGVKEMQDSCGEPLSSFCQAHLDVWRQSNKFKAVEVPTVCWDTLLKRHGMDFDFLSIDIEGETLGLLSIIPPELLKRLKLICYEKDEQYDGFSVKRAQVLSMLTNNGFALIGTTNENNIFGRKQ